MSIDPIVNAIAQAEEPFLKLAAEHNFALSFRREALFAKRIIDDSPKLLMCEPRSVFAAILDAASIGLSLNPTLQHATLVPRNVKIDAKTWVTRATMTPMYRGLLAIAIDDGVVLSAEAEAVYAKDAFRFSKGIVPECAHTPFMGGDRGAFLGVWTLAIITSLGPTRPLVDFMPAEDILKARDSSDAYRNKDTRELAASAPWVRWFNEQAKKTALKRATKLWPHVSPRLAAAVELDHKAEHSAPVVQDDDEIPLIGTADVAAIEALLVPAKLPLDTFLASFGVEAIADLPAARLEEARERLENRARIIAQASVKQ
jgi:recombination protein RecT